MLLLIGADPDLDRFEAYNDFLYEQEQREAYIKAETSYRFREELKKWKRTFPKHNMPLNLHIARMIKQSIKETVERNLTN